MTYTVWRDLSDRKRVEAALREAEEKYRKIFEDAVEGIFQSTREGRLLSVNPAFTLMYGYKSPEEMLGEVTDVAGQLYVDPRDRLALREALEKEGSVDEFEVYNRRRGGGCFWASLNARVVRGLDGSILYYEGMVRTSRTGSTPIGRYSTSSNFSPTQPSSSTANEG